MANAGRRLGALFKTRDAPPAGAEPYDSLSASEPRPDGLLLWLLTDSIDAAGAGPAVASSLAQELEEEVQLLITTDRSAPKPPIFPPETHFNRAPHESAAAITEFLDFWRPDAGLVLGAPATPQLVQHAAQRNIPLFYVSPKRSKGGSQRYPAYVKQFHTCLAASAAEADTARQQFRGKRVSVEISGPLSDTVIAPACDQAECDALARLLGGRSVWLAASVEEGEIEMIEQAHRKAFRSAHRLLLVLVPSDLTTAPGIADTLEAQGWRTGLRSRGDEPEQDTQIYIADTTDELGLWYRLAPSTFVGGTFLPDHLPGDPFAPACLGSAVLHGPYTARAPARFERLGAQGASIMVRSAEELGEAVITLLSPDKAASLAQAGWATTTESAPVIERLVELMLEELDAREGAH